MRTVFVSYRRGDSEGQARALNFELVKLIGKDSVFMDVDSIALGQDFRHVLHERLESCAEFQRRQSFRCWVRREHHTYDNHLTGSSRYVQAEACQLICSTDSCRVR